MAHTSPGVTKAWERFIRGSNAWHSRAPERQVMAVQLFERSVELESTLAHAWVALGAAHLEGIYRGVESDTSLATAKRCFDQAKQLQPEMPVIERGLIGLASA